MAWVQRIPGADLSMRSSSSVSALSYDADGNYTSGGIPFGYCVKRDTSGSPGDVVLASTNDQICGIATSDPATGPSQSISVQDLGTAKCAAGAAITIGDLVSCDSTGRVVTAAAPAATSKYLVGVAEESATAAGDYISVRLGVFGSTNVNA